MSPMYFLGSVPPREILEFEFRVEIVNAHTPSKFSVYFCHGTSDRFERDTEYIRGNRTRREKVISDSRDSRLGVRRQTTYIERVR
jgi:hypothetical protein